jgi:hypothetical protein
VPALLARALAGAGETRGDVARVAETEAILC